MREGRPASVPEAAARARVSIATAYRYFPTADELWEEASLEALDFLASAEEIGGAIEAAGDDVNDRLEVLIRTLGWRMIDDQMPFRQQARAAMDRWFAQQQLAPDERVPVRQGRRNVFTRLALAPLQERLTKPDFEQLVAALGVGWGTEAAISLLDVGNLDPDAAKSAMLATCRWILAGALADAGAG